MTRVRVSATVESTVQKKAYYIHNNTVGTSLHLTQILHLPTIYIYRIVYIVINNSIWTRFNARLRLKFMTTDREFEELS